jgi:cytidylate kinase
MCTGGILAVVSELVISSLPFVILGGGYIKVTLKNRQAITDFMIITISGDPGSGKSTVAKAVAKELSLKHFSAGDFMREMAESKGISLLELGKLAEKDPSIDKEIDERNKHLALKDDFVIDSRLAFHFIPKAIKIFLKVDLKVAAKRTWKDIVAQKRHTEKQLNSETEVYDAIVKRQQNEIERYKKYYGIDFLSGKNYDLVLDTTNLTIEESIQKVLEFVKNIC